MTLTIQHSDTLVYYDGIEVFEGHDSSGSHYIGVLISIEDNVGQYLVTSVSPNRLSQFRAGEVELRQLLLDSSTPEWYITYASGDLSQPLLLEEQHYPFADSGLLPEDGFYLHDSPAADDVVRQVREHPNGIRRLNLRINDPQTREPLNNPM